MAGCMATKALGEAQAGGTWLWVAEEAYLEVLFGQEDDAGQVFFQLPGHILPLQPCPAVCFISVKGLLGNPSRTSI